MSGIVDAAAQLAAEIQQVLTAAGSKAAATTDPDDGFTAAASGDGAVLIGPPTIDYDGTAAGARDCVFPVTVAYRGSSAWDAWQHIDDLLELVASAVDLDTARPAQLAAPNGNGDPIPAYTATTAPYAI